MSSLQKTKAGYRVQFRVSGKGQQISLPDTKKRAAESVQRHLDELLACKRIGERPQELTRQWVESLADDFRERLESFGLVTVRTQTDRPMVQLYDDFLRRRRIKASTLEAYTQTQRKLKVYFGERTAQSVTPADAEDFADFLRDTWKLCENSVRKCNQHVKTFFRWLVRREIVQRNAFELAPTSRSSAINDKRFVPACDIDAILAQTGDPELRLLIALARWAGVRVPSEPGALRWSDIHWKQKTITITASKTDSQRTIPLFPELREHLDAAWEAADPDAEWVLPRVHHGNDNFWRQFRDLILAAGLTPWAKLWSSLRSTRETELAATYPIHVVCAWIGNSPNVALRHYLRVTEADITRAASADTLPTESARQ